MYILCKRLRKRQLVSSPYNKQAVDLKAMVCFYITIHAWTRGQQRFYIFFIKPLDTFD